MLATNGSRSFPALFPDAHQLVHGPGTSAQFHSGVELSGQGLYQVHAKALGSIPTAAVGQTHAIVTDAHVQAAFIRAIQMK